MSLISTLRDKQRERKTALDAAGKILTDAHTAKRSLTGEETQEWERRHADGERILTEIQQVERQIEAERSAPTDGERRGATAGREDTDPTGETGANPEERKAAEKVAFRKWMQGGQSALSDTERKTLERRNAGLDAEARALTVGTGSSGGYTVPTLEPYGLDIALKSYGGILEVAGYIDTDSGATLPYPTMNDTTNSGEALAENAAAATNQDQAFGNVNLGAYMHDSGIVKVPIQLLQDSAFDPETWMNDALRVRLGRKMNNKATVGTGSSQPTGIVTAATAGVTAAASGAITYNEMIDLQHSVDPAYRPNAKFMFNDTTLKLLKKLVDGNSRPLWIAGGVTAGIDVRRPDTFDGYSYVINQDMASPAINAKTVLFGDFSKFKIRRVKQIQFFRFAERFMDSLQIGFLAFIRFDSNLIDAGTNPVKYIAQAAS